MRTLYHAGPAQIDTFNFSKGVHFGAFHSSLEAALRKTETEEDVIYIHKATFKEFAYMHSFDVGSDEAWQKVLKQADEEGYSVVGYTNRYEPGSSFSFIFMNDFYLVDFTVEQMTAEDAEEELRLYHETTADY